MLEYYSRLLKNRDTSYKLFLLKYLFESVHKNIYSFSFYELACGLVSCSWDMINEKAEKFSYHDKLYALFNYIIENYDCVDNYSSQIDIFEFLMNVTDKEIKKRLNNLVAYVPYRLIIDSNISPILTGQTDAKKNKIIMKYTHRSDDTLYMIDKKHIYVRNKYIQDIKSNYFNLMNWINDVIKKELS